MDFEAAFWHCECVCGLTEKVFVSKYRKWCDKHGYNFSQAKALEIYSAACGHFSVMPKTDTAKLLVEQAVSQLRSTSSALAALRQEMLDLASTLPEFPVVMDMFGKFNANSLTFVSRSYLKKAVGTKIPRRCAIPSFPLRIPVGVRSGSERGNRKIAT